MIKSLSLLTRRPELSHDAFVRHWIEIHAPLAHAVPGVRRYVQNHIEGERRRADIATTEIAVDGIADSGSTTAPRWTAPTPRPRQSVCMTTAPCSSAASRPSSSKKR